MRRYLQVYIKGICFFARNRVRPISQGGGLERGALNKGMDTDGVCSLTNVCIMRRAYKTEAIESGFDCT